MKRSISVDRWKQNDNAAGLDVNGYFKNPLVGSRTTHRRPLRSDELLTLKTSPSQTRYGQV